MSTPFCDHEVHYITSRNREMKSRENFGLTCETVMKRKDGDYGFIDDQMSEYIVWTEGEEGIGVITQSGVGHGVSYHYEDCGDVVDITAPENILDLISNPIE